MVVIRNMVNRCIEFIGTVKVITLLLNKNVRILNRYVDKDFYCLEIVFRDTNWSKLGLQYQHSYYSGWGITTAEGSDRLYKENIDTSKIVDFNAKTYRPEEFFLEYLQSNGVKVLDVEVAKEELLEENTQEGNLYRQILIFWRQLETAEENSEEYSDDKIIDFQTLQKSGYAVAV